MVQYLWCRRHKRCLCVFCRGAQSHIMFSSGRSVMHLNKLQFFFKDKVLQMNADHGISEPLSQIYVLFFIFFLHTKLLDLNTFHFSRRSLLRHLVCLEPLQLSSGQILLSSFMSQRCSALLLFSHRKPSAKSLFPTPTDALIYIFFSGNVERVWITTQCPSDLARGISPKDQIRLD